MSVWNVRFVTENAKIPDVENLRREAKIFHVCLTPAVLLTFVHKSRPNKPAPLFSSSEKTKDKKAPLPHLYIRTHRIKTYKFWYLYFFVTTSEFRSTWELLRNEDYDFITSFNFIFIKKYIIILQWWQFYYNLKMKLLVFLYKIIIVIKKIDFWLLQFRAKVEQKRNRKKQKQKSKF